MSLLMGRLRQEGKREAKITSDIGGVVVYMVLTHRTEDTNKLSHRSKRRNILRDRSNGQIEVYW